MAAELKSLRLIGGESKASPWEVTIWHEMCPRPDTDPDIQSDEAVLAIIYEASGVA